MSGPKCRGTVSYSITIHTLRHTPLDAAPIIIRTTLTPPAVRSEHTTPPPGLGEDCVAAEDMPESSRYSVTMTSGRALITTAECAAGLVCGDSSTCETTALSPACYQYLDRYRTEGVAGNSTYLYEPHCEPDGSYSAVQCQTRPDSFMFCFCVTELGVRIDGRDLSTNRADMNCGQSRWGFGEWVQALRRGYSLSCLLGGQMTVSGEEDWEALKTFHGKNCMCSAFSAIYIYIYIYIYVRPFHMGMKWSILTEMP